MVGHSDDKKVIFADIFSTLEDLHVVVGHLLYSSKYWSCSPTQPPWKVEKVVVTRGGHLLATTHMNGKTIEGAWLLMRA